MPDSRARLTEIANILRRLDDPIIEPSRARDFIALLPDDSSALTYEPALAAVAILSYYWEGMSYPDGGLDGVRMYLDIQRVYDLMNRWGFQVLKKLEAELSPAKGDQDANA